ncbi:SEC-C motif-containing protein [Clostridium perfringens]|nr:SEC-C motif-containing protein [Clostridium perfringens]
MERNEKCFCGSGIKYKKCHYGVYENSLVGKKIKFYSDLDKILLNDVKFKCKVDCCECCSDYFYISEEEFLVIMNYMITHFSENEINIIRKKAKEYMKHIEIINKDEFIELNNIQEGIREINGIHEILRVNTNIKLPCVFLKEGRCSIYPVRPTVCRLFGSVSKILYCNNMEINGDFIDYKYLNDKLEYGSVYTEFSNILGKSYIEKPYPIADYIESLYDNYMEFGKYDCAIKEDTKEFIKRKINVIKMQK